jgi:hypothetical protein
MDLRGKNMEKENIKPYLKREEALEVLYHTQNTLAKVINSKYILKESEYDNLIEALKWADTIGANLFMKYGGNDGIRKA